MHIEQWNIKSFEVHVCHALGSRPQVSKFDVVKSF